MDWKRKCKNNNQPLKCLGKNPLKAVLKCLLKSYLAQMSKFEVRCIGRNNINPL